MKKHDYNRLSLLEDRLVRVKSRDIEILVQRIPNEIDILSAL